jgi:F-type H+-transporting ATPase subunit g
MKNFPVECCSGSLAPPTSLSEFGQVYQQLWVKARDVSWWRSIAENGQWLKVAIYAVEAYGIFTIGEMSKLHLSIAVHG